MREINHDNVRYGLQKTFQSPIEIKRVPKPFKWSSRLKKNKLLKK